MKKISLLLLISCIAFKPILSQVVINVDSIQGGNVASFMQVVGGEPFVSAKFVRIVEGSPYVQDDWATGTVLLQNGTSFSNISMRLNILDKQLHFLKDGKEYIVNKDFQKVSFVNAKTGEKQVFISGFSDTQEPALFEVLSAGKTTFLKLTNKEIKEDKPYGSATYEHRIVNKNAYFINDGKQLAKIKLERKIIEDLLSDKSVAVKEFINQNKLNLRNEKDALRLFNFYNSLI
jgi:hypothetical protein